MMRIAITGALGFIGTEVAFHLIGAGHEVVLVDFWEEAVRTYEGQRLPLIERVYWNMARAVEVLTPSQFIEALRSQFSFDAIVHLGAVVDTQDMGSSDMFARNVHYVRELVEAANNGKRSEFVPGIVFASSAAVYGSDFSRPNNPYGLTKSMGERIISKTRGQYANLRLFNVFGPMEHHKGAMASMPFKLAMAYTKGDRLDMHSLCAQRDFVPVGNVVECVAHMLNEMGICENVRATVDVGTGTSTSFADLDVFVMQATRSTSTCIREVPVPKELEGRYQTFTRAGLSQDADRHDVGLRDTRAGIEEYYGRR